MARAKRIIGPGLIYHVMNRGNNKQAIFLDDEDYELYLGLLYRYKKKYGFKIFAYCLMNNHVHVLLKVGEKGTISQIMQAITNAHTRHYHHKYKCSGHVWQGRFKSPVVSDDQYMFTVMQYIEQNPLRAKIVKEIGAYRWNSYVLNVRQKGSKLIDRNDNSVFLNLGFNLEDRIREYRKLMKDNVEDRVLKDVRKSVNASDSYMSERSKELLQESLPKPKRRGRPGKRICL